MCKHGCRRGRCATVFLAVGDACALDRFLFEDYFYYLRVARDLVEGNGVTADVSAPTNGFHPLWMLICTAAIALVGPLHSIYVVLTWRRYCTRHRPL
jgi:hypothetical protein